MATIDSSIPLAAGNIQGVNPQQMMSLAEMGMQMRAQQQRLQAQNALRTIFADPSNVGPNGQLTPQAIQRVSAVDPNTGMQLRQQEMMNQVHQSTIAKNNVQLKESQFRQELDKQQDFQNVVRGPSVIAYQEAIKNGISPAMANQVAQTAFTDGLNELKRSGRYSKEEQDRWATSFDYQRVMSRSQTVKDYLANQEKEKSDNRADRREAAREHHETRMENLSAQREANSEKRLNAAIDARAGDPNAVLDPETLTAMALQYLSGDKSVMTNLGRGVQGARNIVALRKEVTKQAKAQGMAPADISARLAEFGGLQASERAVGTRSANVELAVSEASKFATLAQEASKEVSRTGFVPVNKALQMWQKGTGDPKISKFVAANTSLINAYSRAVSPSGVPAVSDKEHAREMLDTAQTPEQYQAVVGQLVLEMKAAQAAPADVKRELHELHTGKPTAAPAKPAKDFSHLWE